MNHSLKDRLIRHMEDGRYEPQSKSELARALNVDSRQKLDFRALVDQMEEEGKLVRLQKGRYALKRERRNLVNEYPEKVRELQEIMWRYIKDGRSTPGQPQPNNPCDKWEQIKAISAGK